MNRRARNLARSIATIATLACAAATLHAEPDWAVAERGVLRDHVRLTSPDRFIKAGEAYFSPYARWIVFQAIPKPEAGEEPSEHYAMYVARLTRDADGRITGMDEPIRISPPGSANTCGYFNPRRPYEVLFASTRTPPAQAEQQPGYQRESGRYVWPFHHDMNVYRTYIPEIIEDMLPGIPVDLGGNKPHTPVAVFQRDGYTAECAYGPDGAQIVYAQVDPETEDADIYIYDMRTRAHNKIVSAKGYDGGPFFSPDGRRIVYRSDRDSDGKLQVFVGVLELDARGAAVGLREERAVTANDHVNWAPVWHPSGAFIAYTTSEVGHHQYEVFTVQAPVDDRARANPAELQRRRITHSRGFDGLPVFSDDARFMMWTSQRNHPDDPTDTPPSSQVWVAEIIDITP